MKKKKHRFWIDYTAKRNCVGILLFIKHYAEVLIGKFKSDPLNVRTYVFVDTGSISMTSVAGNSYFVWQVFLVYSIERRTAIKIIKRVAVGIVGKVFSHNIRSPTDFVFCVRFLEKTLTGWWVNILTSLKRLESIIFLLCFLLPATFLISSYVINVLLFYCINNPSSPTSATFLLDQSIHPLFLLASNFLSIRPS